MTDLRLFTAWDSATIAQRQDMRPHLAIKVWGMPKKKNTTVGSEPMPQIVGEVAQ